MKLRSAGGARSPSRAQSDGRTRDPRGLGQARNLRPYPGALERPRDFPHLPILCPELAGKKQEACGGRKEPRPPATASSCRRTEDKPPSGRPVARSQFADLVPVLIGANRWLPRRCGCSTPGPGARTLRTQAQPRGRGR
uniref:Uncharacterized protein n=1 Tax=Myotis myotis TaxID=51298 RepID=A0A7J7ZXQ4_MYOMY|nr:hypothetical protein mMyoMyo1_009777 [Myotis myotis]